jgi:hypothetical protein
MKRILPLLLLVAVTQIDAGACCKEDQQAAMAKMRAEKGAQKDAGQYREEMLKKYDTNGDGKIDEEEKRVAMAQKGQGEWPGREEMLKRFDKDGDGHLNEDEKHAAMSAMRAEKNARDLKDWGGKGDSAAQEKKMAYDKNGNGEFKNRQGHFKGEGARGKGAK